MGKSIQNVHDTHPTFIKEEILDTMDIVEKKVRKYR